MVPTITFLRAACLPFLLLLMLLTPAISSAAPAKGLEDDFMLRSPDPQVRAQFWNSVRESNTKSVRVLFRWNGVQTQPEQYYIDAVKDAAVQAKTHGAKLIVGFYAPIWRESPGFRVTPQTVTSYRLFTGYIAQQLRGYSIQAFTTWNEPNFSVMWPKKDAQGWVVMSNAAYDGIKRANPSVQVWVGETAPEALSSSNTSPGQFMRNALCLNAKFKPTNKNKRCKTKLKADGFAVHAYDFGKKPNKTTKNPDTWIVGNWKSINSQLAKIAKSGRMTSKAAKNIHITEFAYRTNGSKAIPSALAAKSLPGAWKIAVKAKWKTFLWYQLNDPAGIDTWESGLRDRFGNPYPSWAAFKKLR